MQQRYIGKDARLSLKKPAGKDKLLQRNDTIRRLERELAQLRSQLANHQDIQQPEPADLLNQLKARRKKSKADLTDVELLLDLFCDGCDR
jgi:hypothetical protein